MIKAVVLSLEGSARRGVFKKNNHCVDYNFFNAVLYEDIHPSEIEIRHTLSQTEVSCAYSHSQIYRDFIASEEKTALILEDDVTVNPDLYMMNIQTLASFIESQSQPTVLFLGGMRDIRSHRIYFVGRKTQLEGIALLKNFHSERFLHRTCCYLLNREAAGVLIKTNSPIRHVADDWSELNAQIPINYYLVKHDIFSHPPDQESSQIHHSRMAQTGLSRVLAVIVRLIKSNFLRSQLLLQYFMEWIKALRLKVGS